MLIPIKCLLLPYTLKICLVFHCGLYRGALFMIVEFYYLGSTTSFIPEVPILLHTYCKIIYNDTCLCYFYDVFHFLHHHLSS